ncbi:hypothetical protein C8A05DRAFT_45898 [Staphylotrichum tortipilum]|uniref:Uncharacterized protein n=1 Tax=Staphylotrichum tortipilum TaxID=2831512 RepID=A0AAN6MG47_9PEZI|nr:hypothetical protein C8A05DRAFT_45898 [Staphylotrichum longicolle]
MSTPPPRPLPLPMASRDTTSYPDTPTTSPPTSPKHQPSPFPPTTIPLPFPSPLAHHHHRLPIPTTWRCGTCHALHPVTTLLSPPASPPTTPAGNDDDAANPILSHCACAAPALQAVYDQFGALYLFWRDDPAVSDLRVPRMAEEARWRVRQAGGWGMGWIEGGWM